MKGLDCMLYTSEILNKSFKSEEECLKAEQEHNEKLALEEKKKAELAETKKTRAKEVEDAFKKVVDAEKEYNELKNKFIKDYGYFHMSYRDSDSRPLTSIFDIFNIF